MENYSQNPFTLWVKPRFKSIYRNGYVEFAAQKGLCFVFKYQNDPNYYLDHIGEQEKFFSFSDLKKHLGSSFSKFQDIRILDKPRTKTKIIYIKLKNLSYNPF